MAGVLAGPLGQRQSLLYNDGGTASPVAAHYQEIFGSYPKSAIELEGFSIQQVGGKTAGVNPQSI